jgi:hypothetical protein
MSNMFTRVALAFGRFTGLKRQTQIDLPVDLFDTGAAPILACDSPDAGQSACESSALDADHNPWNDALVTSDTLARQDTDAAIEAAIATGQLDDLSTDLKPETIEPSESPLIAATLETPIETSIETPTESSIDTPIQVTIDSKSETTDAAPIEIPTVAEIPVVAETPAIVTTAPETPAAAIVEEASPIIEIKPDPLKSPVPQPEPSVTFTQLYELISGEVNKRTDSAVTVYERLLNATREELEATRKNNRIAWSVGGVMTAFAALGAVWAASEVSANRVEVGTLRQQVVGAQQVSLERDQLKTDLIKTREASAKLEIESLQARLDQALTVSAERDRLKDEVQSLRHAKIETENELRVARAAAATQPVSQARPANTTTAAAVINAARVTAARMTADTAAGSERPDVWSMLLDGKDGR